MSLDLVRLLGKLLGEGVIKPGKDEVAATQPQARAEVIVTVAHVRDSVEVDALPPAPVQVLLHDGTLAEVHRAERTPVLRVVLADLQAPVGIEVRVVGEDLVHKWTHTGCLSPEGEKSDKR